MEERSTLPELKAEQRRTDDIRKLYVSPQLVKYGNLRQITGGLQSGIQDAGGKSGTSGLIAPPEILDDGP